MKSRSRVVSIALSTGMHFLLAFMLFFSFEKTINIPDASNEPVQIINASVVTNKALRQEMARLEEKEAQKKAKEIARLEEIARKEQEAKEKKQHEQQLALELERKNELLKKEAQARQLALKQEELAREKKIKEQKEELAKLKKEKEAALALKKKADAEKKLKEAKVAKEANEAKQAKETEQQAEQETDESAQSSNRAVNRDELARHAQLIRQKINQNWRQPLGTNIAGLSCKIEVRLLPTGEVIEAQVIESSGSLEFDRSAEVAVNKSSPLPMPSNEEIARNFRQFTFTFRPEAT